MCPSALFMHCRKRRYLGDTAEHNRSKCVRSLSEVLFQLRKTIEPLQIINQQTIYGQPVSHTSVYTAKSCNTFKWLLLAKQLHLGRSCILTLKVIDLSNQRGLAKIWKRTNFQRENDKFLTIRHHLEKYERTALKSFASFIHNCSQNYHIFQTQV